MNRHSITSSTAKAFPAAKQQGFTLLEILVAIVVMSLGLLGLAGLQAASLRNNQTAYYRGIAAQQVYDMADRIRANLAGVAGGSYDNLGANTPVNPNCFNEDVGNVGCTPATMAVTDHRQWNLNNAFLLPGGVGTVDCIQGPGAACSGGLNALRVFIITVRWPQAGKQCTDELGNVLFANTDCFRTEVSP